MIYSIFFTKTALKELEKLPKNIQSNIAEHVIQLSEEPRPRGCKKLHGDENAWRIRIGHYRVIYSI